VLRRLATNTTGGFWILHVPAAGILAHGWDADLEHKVAQFPDMTIKEDLMQPFARPSEGRAASQASDATPPAHAVLEPCLLQPRLCLLGYIAGDAYLTPCPLGVEPHLNLALIDIEIPGYVSQVSDWLCGLHLQYNHHNSCNTHDSCEQSCNTHDSREQAPLDIEDPAPTTGADLQHPLNK
jgi:hypothetical protein